MGKAYVSKLPTCDIHHYLLGIYDVEAKWDGRTVHGSHGYMCDKCKATHAVGQPTELVVGERPEVNTEDLRKAIMNGDYELAEDLIGDGDLAEYL